MIQSLPSGSRQYVSNHLTTDTLAPSFTIRRFKAGMPSDHPSFAAWYQRDLDALRAAGVPEG